MKQINTVRKTGFEDGASSFDLAKRIRLPWLQEGLEPTGVPCPCSTVVDTRGFEACYAIALHPLQQSAVMGDDTVVSPQQIEMVLSMLPLHGLKWFAITLEHRLIVGRTLPERTDAALVLVVNPEHSNASMANIALKRACEAWT